MSTAFVVLGTAPVPHKDSLQVVDIPQESKTRSFTNFIYEANAAQAWLGDIIRKEPVAIPINPVTNAAPKDARIRKLIVLIEQGKVKLSQSLTELNRQLEQYQYGAHDDAVDALAMIIDDAENFSQFDPEQMKELFDTIYGRSSKNPKKIISYGGRAVDDLFGLMSV